MADKHTHTNTELRAGTDLNNGNAEPGEKRLWFTPVLTAYNTEQLDGKSHQKHSQTAALDNSVGLNSQALSTDVGGRFPRLQLPALRYSSSSSAVRDKPSDTLPLFFWSWFVKGNTLGGVKRGVNGRVLSFFLGAMWEVIKLMTSHSRHISCSSHVFFLSQDHFFRRQNVLSFHTLFHTFLDNVSSIYLSVVEWFGSPRVFSDASPCLYKQTY